MLRRKRRNRPSRRELVERKHQIEGEIRQVRAELRSRSARGEPAADFEARLVRLQSEHYQTRLAIDQAEPGS